MWPKRFPSARDVEVVVLEVDPAGRRIRLSIKAMKDAHEADEVREYANARTRRRPRGSDRSPTSFAVCSSHRTNRPAPAFQIKPGFAQTRRNLRRRSVEFATELKMKLMLSEVLATSTSAARQQQRRRRCAGQTTRT